MADAQTAKPGRPTDYTPELATAICDRLAVGESLRGICALDGMPDKATVFRWIARHEAFRDQYARAREAQADYLADEIIEIADDGSGDYIEKPLGDDGATVSVVDHEHISRSKLRVDARKWFAAKVAPKKYGDRVSLTSPPGEPVEVKDVSARDQIARRIAGLAARSGEAGGPSGTNGQPG